MWQDITFASRYATSLDQLKLYLHLSGNKPLNISLDVGDSVLFRAAWTFLIPHLSRCRLLHVSISSVAVTALFPLPTSIKLLESLYIHVQGRSSIDPRPLFQVGSEARITRLSTSDENSTRLRFLPAPADLAWIRALTIDAPIPSADVAQLARKCTSLLRR